MRLTSKVRVNADFLAQLSFVLYFSSSTVRMIVNGIFGTGNLSTFIYSAIIYLPLLVACVKNPQEYVKLDFFILYFAVLLFFLLTYLIHPEYGYYYGRSEFGIWDHVLNPYRGIYAYWFIRLFNDPKKILKNLRISGWFTMAYFFVAFYIAMQRGYWTGIVGQESSVQLSYSLSFGYSVLPFALIFLYLALKTGNKLDLAGAVIDIAFIFVGGSRGPILFLGIFGILYILTELRARKVRYKGVIFGIIAGVTVFLYSAFSAVCTTLNSLLSSIGVQSRFLTMLAEGTITTDTGRNQIWTTAIQMIKEWPWGYGAMGSRHVLSKIIIAGYPHSIVLEFLIDFGVVLGSIFLVVMAYHIIRMVFFNKQEAWRGLFLIFFSSACALFISMSFWSVSTFWCCLGLAVSKHLLDRRKRIVVKFR
ncbi:MAG: O-antigen ligase family protein [Clostridiales bacterium]|nr:O-antigen ligase family protein [Clostridiales bacterium]